MDKLELKYVAPYLPYGLKYLYTTTINNQKHQSIELVGCLNILDIIHRQEKPILRPLSDLTKDRNTLYDLAIIADCHFKERMQVKDYKTYQEDGCQVCEVSWSDGRNDSFEISWALEYHEGLDERNGNISLSLGSGSMVFNTNRIFELLYSKHYDVERLIEKGLAIDINSIDKQ